MGKKIIANKQRSNRPEVFLGIAGLKKLEKSQKDKHEEVPVL